AGLADHGVCARAPGTRATAEDRRTRAEDAAGRRVSPRHRRRLLHHQGASGRAGKPRPDPRSLPALRPDHHLDRAIHASAAARAAVARAPRQNPVNPVNRCDTTAALPQAVTGQRVLAPSTGYPRTARYLSDITA